VIPDPTAPLPFMLKTFAAFFVCVLLYRFFNRMRKG
jgi:hypothetical protein